MNGTKLAAGATWALPVGQGLPKKEDVPLKWRIAFTELAKQFYRVKAIHYTPPLLGTGARLQIEVFAREDTLNPNRYDIIERNGQMLRKDSRSGVWPVYPEKRKEQPERLARAVRRSNQSRARAQRARELTSTLHEDPWDDNLHSVFCERAEIMDDIKDANLAFERDPTVQNMIAAKAARNRLDMVEMRIAAAAMAQKTAQDIAEVQAS